MPINLSIQQIDEAMPKIEGPLAQYCNIQSMVTVLGKYYDDPEFRREFNHYYRVRRDSCWQEHFYTLMARTKKEKLQFQDVLAQLYKATGRYEASFASKLFATLNPTAPVIDSIVLKKVNTPRQAAGHLSAASRQAAQALALDRNDA
jgi:hypothetical protein